MVLGTSLVLHSEVLMLRVAIDGYYGVSWFWLCNVRAIMNNSGQWWLWIVVIWHVLWQIQQVSSVTVPSDSVQTKKNKTHWAFYPLCDYPQTSKEYKMNRMRRRNSMGMANNQMKCCIVEVLMWRMPIPKSMYTNANIQTANISNRKHGTCASCRWSASIIIE